MDIFPEENSLMYAKSSLSIPSKGLGIGSRRPIAIFLLVAFLASLCFPIKITVNFNLEPNWLVFARDGEKIMKTCKCKKVTISMIITVKSPKKYFEAVFNRKHLVRIKVTITAD